MKCKRICFLFLLSMGLCVLHAQEALPAAGGDASGSTGSISYTAGQTTYTLISGTGGSVNQGVQNAYSVSVVSELEQTAGIMLECVVYPNPTSDYLNLRVDDYELEDLTYELYDMSGNLIEGQKLTEKTTRIEMSHLTPASYLLVIANKQNEIKTFKIIKK